LSVSIQSITQVSTLVNLTTLTIPAVLYECGNPSQTLLSIDVRSSVCLTHQITGTLPDFPLSLLAVAAQLVDGSGISIADYSAFNIVDSISTDKSVNYWISLTTLNCTDSCAFVSALTLNITSIAPLALPQFASESVGKNNNFLYRKQNAKGFSSLSKTDKASIRSLADSGGINGQYSASIGGDASSGAILSTYIRLAPITSSVNSFSSVTLALRLTSISYSVIAANASTLAQFSVAFIDDLVSNLNVDPSQVIIQTIVPGSVIVTFVILSYNGGITAVQAMQLLQAKMNAGILTGVYINSVSVDTNYALIIAIANSATAIDITNSVLLYTIAMTLFTVAFTTGIV